MSLPFSVSTTVTHTPYPGATPQTETFASAGQFDSSSGGRLAISGAGSTDVDFGTSPLAGAKGVFVYYEAGTAPIQVRYGGQDMELSVGGSFHYFNPSPTDGVTALTIVTTAAATVRTRVLG